ncbi:caspase family protein [Streptomyces sp. NPDC096319]|uniref:HD domain-containing protein n=1 Tax=Streptomyces sp. NPDC096319 TaxID=3366084 RepID=UPI003816C25D
MDVLGRCTKQLGVRVSATTAVSGDTKEEEVTGTRRALLIGVGRTSFLERDETLARRFPPLGFVDRDVELVGAALAESGYIVDALHPGHPSAERRDTGVGSIVSAVEDFLLSCAAGDTAFLYVSGHGVTVGEREYLLTSDTRPRADGSLIAQTILETAPEVLLGAVPPGVTVVVCLDTCRTDQPPSPTDPDEARLVNSAYRDLAWLLASGRGQPAYADPEKGSYFGIALSEALSRNSPPKTLKDVYDFVRSRVERLTARLTEPPPTVDFQCVQGLAERLVLCRGSQETQRWSEAVAASALWQHTSHAEAHDRVKDKLADLAREVAKSRLGTDSALATPWNDPDYPIRVVDRLGRLVEAARLTGRERLSPAETAALLAAPLLHEGVVAIALSELAALRPDRIDRSEDGRGRAPVTPHDHLVCDAARDVSRAHSQVSLAAETLRRRHLTAPATAADHWLRHRFIADWDRLWDATGDYAAVDHLLTMVVEAVTAGSPAEASPQNRTLIDRQLRQVLAHVTVAPGSSPRINDSGELRWNTHPAVPGNQWRAPDLAYLVWLASLLAADPRRMSSVLVDHLGAHRRLVPSDVTAALSEYRLESPDEHERRGDDGYDLAVHFLCPHPALHAAVEELAATADASVRARHKSWKEARTTAPDLLRGIPRKVTGEFLEPLEQQYTKPLERFRLAEDEIRPLLMGTQLYGDKMLAVRELYQNALDACRYRQLRAEYGRRLRKCGTKEREPEISFVQGYDEEDRPYIECRDTGTGMNRRKLTSMFARAGKRYEQDPDFVQERRNWRRAGIEPVPFNSRFGIGVFSYFMLAEEVVVTTATTDLHGNPSRTEPPLQAVIQSGSGLLEIRETAITDPEGGGTRVRLYLNADGEAPPSLVDTLRSLLWVSDHKVTAVELDREGNRIRSETWTPGVLQSPEQWPANPVDAGEGGWIVQGKGQLLLDGVLVKNAPPVHGFVFNLRESHRPVPTVDRNGLLSYAREDVDQQLFDGLRAAVTHMDVVSLRWLWDLAEEEPQLAVRLLGALPAETTGRLETSHDEHSVASAHIPLRRAGCLPLDSTLIRLNSHDLTLGSRRNSETNLLRLWRWSALGLVTRQQAFAPWGYPSPQGLDALLFLDDVPQGGWAETIRAAALAQVSLGEALRALRRYAIAGVQVPAAEDVRVLLDFRPTELMAELSFAYEHAAGARATGRVSPAEHAPLVVISAEWEISPATALPALQELALMQPGIPDPSRLEQTVLDTRLSDREAHLLAGTSQVSRSLDSRPGWNWRESEWTALDLLDRAPSPKERRRLVDHLTALAPLGFAHSFPDSAELLDRQGLQGAELRLLSKAVSGRRPLLRDCHIPLHELVHRCAHTGLPLGLAATRINALAQITGVTVAEVPAEAAEWTPPPWLVPEYAGDNPFLSPIGPWRLLAHLQRADTARSGTDLRHDFAMLKACGALSPLCAELGESLLDRSRTLSQVLVDLLGLCYPDWTFAGDCRWDLDEGSPDLAVLMALASRRSITMGEVADQLRNTPTPLPLDVPTVPDECRGLAPSYRDVSRLQDDEEHEDRQGFLTVLPLKDVVMAVGSALPDLGAAVAHLTGYRSLGGPALPGPFTGPDAKSLEDFVPDDFDLAAFDDGLLGPGTLGPLELVLVAGRFGWTLGKAYERYAPFRCLGLDVTVGEPVGAERDVEPDWRDVIVLTTELTGRAPALERAVDPDHVQLCSEETDLSAAEVLDRLRQYARLFDLDLPSSPGGPTP